MRTVHCHCQVGSVKKCGEKVVEEMGENDFARCILERPGALRAIAETHAFTSRSSREIAVVLYSKIKISLVTEIFFFQKNVAKPCF